MSSPDIQRLREIKTFPSLVKYLRDELDWPIESEDFDELYFEYEPDELGIDAKTAVKIKDIKQLRPLSSKQPWGIFFINFEPKQLPIVVLRRILRSLVLKKRASANKSQQAAWQLHDLLFISSYGETDHREITFAHFSEPTNRLFGDLPTLRVLGWDDDDTKLKIDHVVHTLSEKLRWPGDEDDTKAWRTKWSDAFELRPREVITTSKELAVRLADLAKSIRNRANLILSVESERGALRQLHKAFQTALIHDLNEDDFADMYAQTIAYGLLAARVSRPAGVIADNLADMIPTNPFLKDMLGIFLTVGGRKGKIDFDELGIQEVVDLLNNPDTHIEDVLRDFGKKTMQEDPVIHFYELFLNEYDKKKKVKRGVFYTPQPVVSYIVRSVHELLKTEFGLEDGLASTVTWGEMVKRNSEIKIPEGVSPDEPFVLILDIATGTATFLVEVIEVIYNTMVAKWKKEGHLPLEFSKLWNEYVPKHLLPRLYGFELMMAPYAIAHMKIGLKLAETGYRFGSEERAHIYLTNSLEPPSDVAEQPQFEEMAPALAHEAKAVNAVKRHKRFTVVMGNPPYAGLSANLTEQARQIVSRFKFINGVKIKERGALQLERNLQDDYIKFLAFAEDRLIDSSNGVCGVICNHGFVDNPTLRGVRYSLLQTFRDIYLLDLHGNVNRGEKSPDGTDDQNVFDIKDAGVAIFLGVKGQRVKNEGYKINKNDLWGDREDIKYPFLMARTVKDHPWETVLSMPDLFLFRTLSGDGTCEYTSWLKVTEVFPLHSIGMITARDSYVIDFMPDQIIQRARAFQASRLNDEDTCKSLGIPIKKGWNINRAREKIKHVKNLADFIQPVLYRPFDIRPVFYHASLIWGMAWPVMQHMVGGNNLALITSRMTKGEEFHHVLVSKNISEVILLSSKTSNNAFAFPLYLQSETSALQLGKRLNLSLQFLKLIGSQMCMQMSKDSGLPQGLSPHDIFYYIYCVLHSGNYRTRYAEFLKIDFPRLPLTNSLELFKSLAKLGGELVALHVMESPKLDQHITRFIGKGSPEIEKVSFSDETVWIDKAKSQGFQGVPENIWNFLIGGYQVCEKWLKDRGPKSGKPARTLSADDINHYHRIVVALNETIRIMAEIDKVIEAHGGWPGAFLTKEEKESSVYDVQPQPVLKAAEEISEYKKQKSSAIHLKVLPLKKDWKTWFALSQWAQETMRINSYWINFANEISKNLKEGTPLTDKQKEDMSKCWQQAIKKGFTPS